MGRPVRAFLGVLLVVVAAAPLSVVATILLRPFWSWFEASTGIESLGHSGPAEWCYLLVFLLLVAGGTLLILRPRREKEPSDAG